MKHGWFIPLILGCFGLSMTGLWLYLSMADTESELADVRRRTSTVFFGEDVGGSLVASASDGSTARNGDSIQTVALVENSTRRTIVEAAGRRAGVRQFGGSLLGTLDSLAAELHRMAERVDDEIAHFRSDLRQNAFLELAYGWHALETGHTEASLAHFDRALRYADSNAGALSGKASALTTLRRFDEALAVYERLLNERGDDAQAHYNAAVLLARIGRVGAGAEHLRSAVAADPKHARAWFNLASLAQRDGRLSEARTAWERFTELEPSIATGWYNLGLVYMDYQMPDDAARCFSFVVMIDPTDVDGYVNLASACRASGDVEAALWILRQADGLSGCDPIVLQALADSHRTHAAMFPDHSAMHLEEAFRIENELAAIEAPWGTKELAAGYGEGE